ncbi:MAG TPA: T9SS type A sorting domain-containing protein [Candidatus Kapabacteria bacterium]|nr:T9SS type A sorting domain-containing protein [Candidatus Kapabacteria bacterium]
MVAFADARAQRFERLFGGTCSEEAHNGVQPVSEGGYVAVGQTNSTTGCGATDVYVVRTKDDGSLLWSRTYHIGSWSVGNDIEEVKTAAGAGDGFIITGATQDPNGCNGVNQDLLVLRIDRCGSLRWVRTVDDNHGYETGWDVKVAANTDFIIAGQTISDGFLVRFTAAGTFLWGRRYDGSQHGVDYFYAVDEAANGDIIAAGGTHSVVNNGLDGWIVRVSSTGTFTSTLHNALAYGGSASVDDFRSVQELKMGPTSGDIVAVGRTDSLNAGAPDVALVEVSPDLCSRQTAQKYGDNGADEGFCVREIAPATSGDTSNLIVTGYLTPPTTVTHGGQDAFLKEFRSGTLAQLPGATGAIYGSSSNDMGWSLSPVTSVAGFVTDGYIVAGRGYGTAANPQQLYLFKTNLALSDSCTQYYYSASSSSPGFNPECDTSAQDAGSACTPEIDSSCNHWQDSICVTSDGMAVRDISSCPTCSGLKRVANPDLTEGETDMNESALRIYPSPIQRNAALTLEYTMGAEGRMEIAVSDITGKLRYQRGEDAGAGTRRTSIGTEGWPSGTYVVRVTINDRVYTRHVVVLAR